ncbi:MAG: hypothetical protein LWX56_05470 [Ignavibacteria bacterium]|nr:hypothetical protein [Ignavibacteria bacterium]
MTFRRVFWGIMFLSLGIVYLLVQAYPAFFHVPHLGKLWPLILVVIGASYLVKNERARYIIAGAGGLLLALILFSFFHKPLSCISSTNLKTSDMKLESYSKPYDGKIKDVSITLDAGAGTYIIASDDQNLLAIKQPERGFKFTVDTLFDDTSANFRVDMQNVHFRFSDDENKPNGLTMLLHKGLRYAFDINIGAASADFDFTDFLVKDCTVKMGAASLNLRLGQPSEESADISIDAGASSIALSVPKDVAVELETDMALSSKSLPDLEKNSDDVYRSKNYNSAKKKYRITVNGGVSSLAFSQY